MKTAADLRKLNIEELRKTLGESKKTLAKTVFERSNGKTKDVHTVRKLRHEVANLLLVISEKELVS
jgi:ribosomal protein L29